MQRSPIHCYYIVSAPDVAIECLLFRTSTSFNLCILQFDWVLRGVCLVLAEHVCWTGRPYIPLHCGHFTLDTYAFICTSATCDDCGLLFVYLYDGYARYCWYVLKMSMEDMVFCLSLYELVLSCCAILLYICIIFVLFPHMDIEKPTHYIFIVFFVYIYLISKISVMNIHNEMIWNNDS